MELMSRFGQNLRALRQRAGFSQQRLAAKLGYIGQSPISQWETGKIELPEPETVRRIAQELDCSAADLLRGVVTPWDALRGSMDIPAASRDDVRLTDAEVALIRLWRRLPEAQQEGLRWILEASVRHARQQQRKTAPGAHPALPPLPSETPPAAAPPQEPARRPKRPHR
jgi:transcriptional regulator with XRE-family HTH domain